jgi:hypothetical protein
MDNQKHQKDTFYTRQPCLHGTVFSPTGVHTCAPVHPTGVHICAPVHCTGAHECTPVHYTGALSGVPVQLTGVHTCAPVQPTGVPIVRALYSLNHAPMHVYPVDKRARVRAYYPLNTFVRPSVQPLPKK